MAEDVRALVALPPFASSAMDGWAIAGDGPWRVVGGVLAGQASEQLLADGEAVAIATGAAVPDGAQAILRREHGTAASGWLQAAASAGSPPPGTDVRPAGQEAGIDELLLAAGTRLTPAAIGLLAAAGHDEVEVRRRPRVALLVLGDELLSSGLPGVGRIRDVLGPQLPMWIERAGALTTRQLRVPDTAASLAVALAEMASSEDVDVVVTTGSTAAGPADHLHAVLHAAGAEVPVDGVAVRPGHPMLLALLPPARAEATGARTPTPLVGLPGNPLGALAGLVTLAIPLLQAVGGQVPDEPRHIPAALDIRGRGRHTLIPGRPSPHDGRFAPTGWDSPHMLRGVAAATGFGVVPEQGVRQGEPLQWLPLPQ
ncbi:MAG: molybdopterin molybdotransferase MoeA [Actinobacteria bacterium]|nr:MAG: molybdopterin molybdotransferase MoeA [Actinomycetota bacterium]